MRVTSKPRICTEKVIGSAHEYQDPCIPNEEHGTPICSPSSSSNKLQLCVDERTSSPSAAPTIVGVAGPKQRVLQNSHCSSTLGSSTINLCSSPNPNKSNTAVAKWLEHHFYQRKHNSSCPDMTSTDTPRIREEPCSDDRVDKGIIYKPSKGIFIHFNHRYTQY